MAKEINNEQIQKWLNCFEEIIREEEQCAKDKQDKMDALLSDLEKRNKKIQEIAEMNSSLPDSKELGCQARSVNYVQLSDAIKSNKSVQSVIKNYQRELERQKNQIGDKLLGCFDKINKLKEMCAGQEEITTALNSIYEKYRGYQEIVQCPEQEAFIDKVKKWLQKNEKFDIVLKAKTNQECEQCINSIDYLSDAQKKDILAKAKDICSFSEMGKRRVETAKNSVFEEYKIIQEGKKPFWRNPKRLKTSSKVCIPLGSIFTGAGLIEVFSSLSDLKGWITGVVIMLLPSIAVLALGIRSKIVWKEIIKETNKIEELNAETSKIKNKIAESYIDNYKKVVGTTPLQSELEKIGGELDNNKSHLAELITQWRKRESRRFFDEEATIDPYCDKEFEEKKSKLIKGIPEEVTGIFEMANKLLYKDKDYRKDFILEARHAENSKGIIDAYYHQESIIKEEKFNDEQLKKMEERNIEVKKQTMEQIRIIEKTMKDIQEYAIKKQEEEEEKAEQAHSDIWLSFCSRCENRYACLLQYNITSACPSFIPIKYN